MSTKQDEAGTNFVTELAETPDGEAVLTCMQCGICSGSCPLGEAMEYPPRKIILESRYGNLDKLLASPSVWMCVGCYICSFRCPREIELTDILWPALRDAAMQKDMPIPTELQETFQNIYKYGNSLGQSPRQRLNWAKDLDVTVRDLSKDPQPVEVLWLVGCYPSYYPRNQVVTRAFARIMTALGVRWGILGAKEKSVGECEGLFGEAGLFDMLMENNKDLFERYQFEKIVTLDPHSFRALQRFYPQYGVNYPVEHYTTFLAERIEQLRPMLNGTVEATVTYHDNCCAGRRCRSFDSPRTLLEAIPGVALVEMARNRENALCCGGGAGGMWLDSHITEHGGHRLSDERIREAADTGADTLAVSCPYELSRFEDSAKVAGLENQLVVRDIIELLAASMELGEKETS